MSHLEEMVSWNTHVRSRHCDLGFLKQWGFGVKWKVTVLILCVRTFTYSLPIPFVPLAASKWGDQIRGHRDRRISS